MMKWISILSTTILPMLSFADFSTLWIEIDGRMTRLSELSNQSVVNARFGKRNEPDFSDPDSQVAGYSYVTVGQYDIPLEKGSCEKITNQFYSVFLKDFPKDQLYSDHVVACIPSKDANQTVFQINLEPQTTSATDREVLNRYLAQHQDQNLFGFNIHFSFIKSMKLNKRGEFVHYINQVPGPQDFVHHERGISEKITSFAHYESVREFERRKMVEGSLQDLYGLLQIKFLPDIFDKLFEEVLPKINYVQLWNRIHFELEENSNLPSRWALGIFRSCNGSCRER